MNQSLKILIADDETAIREGFKNLLEDYNYEVVEAVNGKECLELFKKENPDLILLDIRMPEMDGLKVLEQLTRISPDTPVIIISGAGVISDVVDALHFGAWDYLLKPIKNLDNLIESIKKALGRSQLYKENRRYRKHLEQEVKERTRKHEAANRELRKEVTARKKSEKDLLSLNERMKGLVKSFREIDSAVCLEKASKIILKEFAKSMNANGGSFFLRHSDAFILQSSMDNIHVPPSIPVDIRKSSVFKKAVTKKTPVLIEDISKEKEIDPSGWDGYSDGSVLVFPLLDRENEIMGLISLHNKNYPPFNGQDLDVGTVFASYCGEKIQAVKAVDALRKNEEKYRFIAENTNDVIWTVNMDLDYTYISPSITKLTGEEPKGVIGKNLRNVLTEESYNRFIKVLYKEIEKEKRDEKYLTLELELKKIDGSIIFTEEQITILKSENEFIGILGVSRDITKKKDLEHKLRQAQKMESIGTLAGGIAHDFNNILAGILGNTELLRIKLPEEEFYEKKLRSILSAIDRARDLVSQILEFSRQMESKRQDMDARILVKELSKLLRSILPSTIRINCLVGSDPLYINADVNQIHQVIMNLCTNSHHAMKKTGGVLTLSISDYKECSDNDKRWILLSVKDTGHGIPEDIIDRIFDPYFTTKDLGVGTGLGLSVVHGIVESHGGKISLESCSKGTEFKILLPRVMKAVIKEIPEKIKSTEKKDEKILFVDDEISIVEVCRDMLEHLGFNVLTTTSSVEALEIFKKEKESINLVITDLTMPEMTGDLLAHKIKNINPEVPIIMCTGYSEHTYNQDSQKSVINDLLVKPVKIVDLSKAINNFL